MTRGVEAPVAERFAAMIDLRGPIPAHRPRLGRCHIWTGAIGTHGYGVITMNRATVTAHRLAFFLHHGRWPVPFALHKCDNRQCCRYSHIFEGTPKSNQSDCVAKDRQARGARNGRAKFTDLDVLAMRHAARLGVSVRQLAAEFETSISNARKIVNSQTWRHL